MCQQIRCRDCGKPTWTGCGRHIESALANVPKDARCKCGESPDEGKKDGNDPSAAPRKKLFGIF